jgi:hypothetical protein
MNTPTEKQTLTEEPGDSPRSSLLAGSPDFWAGVQHPASKIIAALVAAEGDRSDAIELLAHVADGFGITGEEIRHYQNQPSDVLRDSRNWETWDAVCRKLEKDARSKWANK